MLSCFSCVLQTCELNKDQKLATIAWTGSPVAWQSQRPAEPGALAPVPSEQLLPGHLPALLLPPSLPWLWQLMPQLGLLPVLWTSDSLLLWLLLEHSAHV